MPNGAVNSTVATTKQPGYARTLVNCNCNLRMLLYLIAYLVVPVKMTIKRILTYITMMCFCGACSIAPPKLELPGKLDAVSDIYPYLEKATNKGSPPSITLAIIHNNGDHSIKSFGYTDVSRSARATEDTVYQWWSLTKLFTSTAIAQMQEKGLLDIDDPVEKHLPYFKVKKLDETSEPITIRQLLSHSSGLGDIGMSILGWIHYENDPSISQTELLKEKISKYNKLKAQPGLEGRYSNFGYIVLAALIEQVSGVSYESYIIKHILTPLEMNNTNFVYTNEMSSSEAIGSHPRDALSYVVPFYIDSDKTFREQRDGRIWFNRVYSDQKGSTGLIGSAADIVKFMKVILNKGEHNGVRILSEESINEMQNPIIAVHSSPAPDSENLAFGLGWFIGESDKGKTLSHGGAAMGFASLLRLYPEQGKGTVVFSNSTYLGRSMGNDVIRLISDAN